MRRLSDAVRVTEGERRVMSPSVPISRFVDDPEAPTFPPEQPVDESFAVLISGKALSPPMPESQFQAEVDSTSTRAVEQGDGERIEAGASSEAVRRSSSEIRRTWKIPGTLTSKQLRFVDEYLVDLNATQAAIRAGYSKRTARAIGCENLTKPDIRTKIQARLQEHGDEAQLARERVLKGLMRIADADIGQLFDQDGKLLPVGAWPEGIAPAVKSCRSVVTGKPGAQNHGRVTMIVLHDKVRVLSRLLDYLAPKSKPQ
jgi:phage terminase small subunit